MLPDNAVAIMTGDLIVPGGFRFSIECKAVNADIDFLAPSALFDKWLLQATDDAFSIGKLPLLCWKKHRRGWIAAVPFLAFRCGGNLRQCLLPEYCVRYREWLVCRLDALLEVDEPSFWFIDEAE
jgi:hypothetical protein